MKFSIPIDSIPSAGLVIDEKIDRDWIGTVLGVALRQIDESGRIRLELHRRDANVKVDGEVEIGFTFDCSRCAEGATEQLAVPIGLSFTRGTDCEGEDGGDINVWGIESGRDLVFHDGSTVELEQPLIELLVFALPTYPLCRPDCKGLCPSCGADLNRTSCSCEEKKVDPRWAKLAELKLGD